MKGKVILINLVIIALAFKLHAQDKTLNDVENLRSKSGYLLASGTVITCLGAVLTGYGVYQFKLGYTSVGTIGNPVIFDHKPGGRILLALGGPLFAGGLAIRSSGIYFRTVYLKGKKQLFLKTGYLGNASAGSILIF